MHGMQRCLETAEPVTTLLAFEAKLRSRVSIALSADRFMAAKTETVQSKVESLESFLYLAYFFLIPCRHMVEQVNSGLVSSSINPFGVFFNFAPLGVEMP